MKYFHLDSVIIFAATKKDISENKYSDSTMSTQGVFPMIAYKDGPAAMDWLARAFGFLECKRMIHQGRLIHGEMETGFGLIMMATPSPDYQGPRQHRQHYYTTHKWSALPWVIDGFLMSVNNIDEHI
jgi:PhnB protein